MHTLTKIRRAQTEHRHQYEGQPNLRPILTGTARKGVSPSDIEGLPTLGKVGYAADGSFPFLAGYDDVEAYP